MHVIQPAGRAGLFLPRGARLRVTDIEGGQVADLTAFRAGDVSEWLSNGRSFDYGGTLRFTTGATLYSNKSEPMLTIEDDPVGRHDFLYTACSLEMYRLQYGATGPHANCLDNLRAALADLGLQEARIPTPFNVFMNVEVRPDGSLEIQAPLSGAGDSITFEARMDLAVALSACPARACNAGTPGPVGFEIDLDRPRSRTS